MTTCLHCSNFSLRDGDKEWARMGFGNCARREKFIMFNATKPRDCEHHVRADDATVARREAWAAKLEKVA